MDACTAATNATRSLRRRPRKAATCPAKARCCSAVYSGCLLLHAQSSTEPKKNACQSCGSLKLKPDALHGSGLHDYDRQTGHGYPRRPLPYNVRAHPAWANQWRCCLADCHTPEMKLQQGISILLCLMCAFIHIHGLQVVGLGHPNMGAAFLSKSYNHDLRVLTCPGVSS